MITIKWMYFLLIVSFHCCHGQGKSRSKHTSSKIAVGKNVDISAYPFVGSLEYGGIFRCTAILILLGWLTIPGDCLSKNEIKLIKVKGRIRLGTSYRLMGGTFFPIHQIIVHPYYPDWDDENIAITQLAVSIQRSYLIDTILMWHPNDDRSILGAKITVAGFGMEKEGIAGSGLKAVTMKVIDNRECDRILRKVSKIRYNITSRMFCAMPDKAFPCLADTGGPALYKNKRKVRHLLGILVEKSGKCELPTMPAIFMRISRYYTWITKLIEFYYLQPDSSGFK